jgi:hypothetical protein
MWETAVNLSESAFQERTNQLKIMKIMHQRLDKKILVFLPLVSISATSNGEHSTAISPPPLNSPL